MYFRMSSNRSTGLLLDLEEQFLECAICTEIFDEDNHLPYALPCHHTFCRDCLRKISKKSSLKCPTCNEVHHIKKDTTKFPKDNIRRDLKTFVDSLRSEKASEVVKCHVCESCSEVFLFCKKCNIYLCYLCKTFHSTKKDAHSLEQKSNYCNQGPLDHCFNPTHHYLPLIYYCECTNCQVLLCPICVVENHRDPMQHAVFHIKDVLDRKIRKINHIPHCTTVGAVLQKLEEQFLECPVCTEIFDEDKYLPYRIPCHHTFCKECLKRIMDKTSLKCPTCNKIHHINREMTKFHKDNTRRDLKSFVESVQSQEATQEVKCHLCETCSETYLFCQKCNLYLCYKCRNLHSIINSTHLFIQTSKKRNALGQDILEVCHKRGHHNAPLIYYCETNSCQAFICPVCVIKTHRVPLQHDIFKIDEVVRLQINSVHLKKFLEDNHKIGFIDDASECCKLAKALQTEHEPTRFLKEYKKIAKSSQELIQTRFETSDAFSEDMHAKLKLIYRRLFNYMVTFFDFLKDAFGP